MRGAVSYGSSDMCIFVMFLRPLQSHPRSSNVLARAPSHARTASRCRRVHEQARLGQDNTATPGQVGSNHHAAVGRERKQFPASTPHPRCGRERASPGGSRAGRQTGGSERFNVQSLTGSARLGEEAAAVAAAAWRVTACVQAPAGPFCAPEHGSAPPQLTPFHFLFIFFYL